MRFGVGQQIESGFSFLVADDVGSAVDEVESYFDMVASDVLVASEVCHLAAFLDQKTDEVQRDVGQL